MTGCVVHLGVIQLVAYAVHVGVDHFCLWVGVLDHEMASFSIYQQLYLVAILPILLHSCFQAQLP